VNEDLIFSDKQGVKISVNFSILTSLINKFRKMLVSSAEGANSMLGRLFFFLELGSEISVKTKILPIM